jgi:uncharacterized YigZ family protein
MNSTDRYLTIAKSSRGTFRDRGSKFLAFAFPVSTKEEIKSHLEELRKEYHDARHHCYAYRLGAAKTDFRSNDDGEPSGSAGQPILGQIRSRDLSNVLIVVVRYFGGTLLGVGGLINAYRSAAAEALQNARIIEAVESIPVLITYPYELTNEIMKLVGEEKLEISEQEFLEICRLKVLVPKSRLDGIIERINRLEAARAEPLDNSD